MRGDQRKGIGNPWTPPTENRDFPSTGLRMQRWGMESMAIFFLCTGAFHSTGQGYSLKKTVSSNDKDGGSDVVDARDQSQRHASHHA